MMFISPTIQYSINSIVDVNDVQETNTLYNKCFFRKPIMMFISPYIHYTDISNSIHSTMKNKRKTEYTTILSL